MKEGNSYAESGVDYDPMDRAKILFQEKARETAFLLKYLGLKDVEDSRGESAYVWEEEDRYGAITMEGLGTKNIVAHEMRKITGQTYYDHIGYCTVSTIINDLLSVGATPHVITSFIAANSKF